MGHSRRHHDLGLLSRRCRVYVSGLPRTPRPYSQKLGDTQDDRVGIFGKLGPDFDEFPSVRDLPEGSALSLTPSRWETMP